MLNLSSYISTLRDGLSHILFPNVCLCCGEEPLLSDEHLCTFCLHKRFEDANPENNRSAAGIILPDMVEVQHALWKFDKGGALQNLMHHLKYERLVAVGTQLGGVLARRVRSSPVVKTMLETGDAVLVPVPLHYLKFRKRGFNQAFHIARGIEQEVDIPICAIDAVVRSRFTRSQTGFTLEQRIKNMREAFKVRAPEAFRDKMAIIVDDVFTTGSTSFELAKTIKEADPKAIMIWTIAQA